MFQQLPGSLSNPGIRPIQVSNLLAAVSSSFGGGVQLAGCFYLQCRRSLDLEKYRCRPPSSGIPSHMIHGVAYPDLAGTRVYVPPAGSMAIVGAQGEALAKVEQVAEPAGTMTASSLIRHGSWPPTAHANALSTIHGKVKG